MYVTGMYARTHFSILFMQTIKPHPFENKSRKSPSPSIYYPGELSPLAGFGQSFPFESFLILA